MNLPAVPDQTNNTPAAVQHESQVAHWATDLGHAVQVANTIVDTPLCPDQWWPVPPGKRLWELPDKNPRLVAAGGDPRAVPVAASAGSVHRGDHPDRGRVDRSHHAARRGERGVRHRGPVSDQLEDDVGVAQPGRGGSGGSSSRRTRVARWRSGTLAAGEGARSGMYEFTMDRAIRAGYVKGKGPNQGGKGGNDKYNTDPQAMLYARCASIAAETEAPDVLRGLASAEAMTDETSRDPEPVSVSARVTAEDLSGPRKALPNGDPDPAPVVEPEPPVVVAEDAPAGCVTGAAQEDGCLHERPGCEGPRGAAHRDQSHRGPGDRVGEGTHP